MKKLTVLMILAQAVLLSVSAGIHYKAKTTDTSSEQRKANETEVEAWIQGEDAKILFKESDTTPMAEPGSYILTNDGGKTMYLVNPKDKTYMEWNMDAMLGFAGGMMEAMGGMMSFEFSDPKVEQLESKSGGDILGIATKYYKFRTTYDMSMKVIGMKRFNSLETITETWVTNKYDKEVGLGVWLRNRQFKTGDENLDKIINAEMEKAKGFPLKSVTVTTTKQYNKKRTKVKKQTTTRSEMNVTEWKEERISADMFKMPEGYERIEFPLASNNGDSKDGDSGGGFKNLFKRN